MPSIVIREADLSTVPQGEVLTNAVYIPGYAIKGPVNEPTLCQSLTEFRNIFGSTPYVFKNDQNFVMNLELNTGKFNTAGSYEKSYIIASELLAQGLPVLYERVMPSSLIEDWTATATGTGGSTTTTFTFNAAYPGYYYNGIKAKVEQDSSDTDIYILTVTFGTDAYKTFFTADASKETSTVYYIQNLIGQLDNSGLVRIVALETDTLAEITLEVTASNPTTTDEFTVSGIYGEMFTSGTPNKSLFTKLEDKGEYVLRFISSGAYATLRAGTSSEASTEMLRVAAARGDCVALIDDVYTGNVVDPTNSDSTYSAVKTFMTGKTTGSYGAVFTPFARYYAETIAGNGSTYTFDTYASFAYLFNYAKSAQQNNAWDAVAGFERGTLTNCVALLQPITNAIANELQPRKDIAINPICYIRPQGIVIWGSRTLNNNALKGELTAQSFLNIRNACSSIKRQTWFACKSLTFEQNTDILWVNFKGMITPLLDQMVTGGGIQSYSIVRVKTDKKATVKAKITIAPIEPVEDWDITLELTDATAVITE